MAINKILFLLLTPVYLGLIIFKSTQALDLMSIFFVSLIIFIIYMPIQIIISEQNIPLELEPVLDNEDIQKVVIPIFGIVSLILINQFLHLDFLLMLMYGLWWFITGNLIKTISRSNLINKYKMIGMFVFLISLLILSLSADIISKNYIIDDIFYTILNLLALLLVSFIMLIIVIPQLGWFFLKLLFANMLKDINIFHSKKQTYTSSEDQYEIDNIVENLGMGIYIIFICYVLIFLPLLNAVTNFFNSLDPFYTSAIVNITFILISGFGAYLQLRLFTSSFFKDYKKSIKTTLISMGILYIIIFINMGLVNKIDNDADSINNVQKNLNIFNNKIQNKVK